MDHKDAWIKKLDKDKNTVWLALWQQGQKIMVRGSNAVGKAERALILAALAETASESFNQQNATFGILIGAAKLLAIESNKKLKLNVGKKVNVRPPKNAIVVQVCGTGTNPEAIQTVTQADGEFIGTLGSVIAMLCIGALKGTEWKIWEADVATIREALTGLAYLYSEAGSRLPTLVGEARPLPDRVVTNMVATMDYENQTTVKKVIH